MPMTWHCPQCGTDFTPWGTRGGQRRFCTPKCRADFNARAKVEGALIISLAKAWRVNRGKGETAKAAFSEMVSILDMLNARDREMGRPNVTGHVGRLVGSGRYIDRIRSQ